MWGRRCVKLSSFKSFKYVVIFNVVTGTRILFLCIVRKLFSKFEKLLFNTFTRGFLCTRKINFYRRLPMQENEKKDRKSNFYVKINVIRKTLISKKIKCSFTNVFKQKLIFKKT